jgi:hypothetical protein
MIIQEKSTHGNYPNAVKIIKYMIKSGIGYNFFYFNNFEIRRAHLPAACLPFACHRVGRTGRSSAMHFKNGEYLHRGKVGGVSQLFPVK